MDLLDARGQCYDGAATMSGIKTGVATQLKAINKKMLFTHCHGHALNLAIKDACTKITCLSEAFETTREICKLVKKSPQRDTMLKEFCYETSNPNKTVHDFCPTRWTVRGETLGSVINNFNELMDLWDWSLEILKDREMKARINGVKAIMPKFSFFFSCALGEIILRQTDNLSRSLQATESSAVEGQNLAQIVVNTLRNNQSDENFDMFWETTLSRKEILNIEDPILPRKRKMPARYNEGDNHSFPESPKVHYRKIYFEVYDFVINAIESRFNQNDYVLYRNIQELLLKSAKNQSIEKEFNDVSSFYAGDLSSYNLKTQLKLLSSVVKEAKIDAKELTIKDFFGLVRSFKKSQKELLSQVVVLTKLLLVALATNAVSERSFSALKRLKT